MGEEMIRLFFLLLSFGFCIMGFMYMILYLNLLTIGYSLYDYFKFIITRIECIQGFIGFIMLSITIFYKGDKDNDLYI